MQSNSLLDERPIVSMADERLDFDYPAPLRQSYIVASSYRCGSTYLCRQLGATGVLGAPSEVLNTTTNLMNRLKASSPADFIAKLLARRTSRNGVFGMKGHFHHFEAFLNRYPELLEVLSPITYIYISRLNKVAQAVSMAKALRTNQWSSRGEKDTRPPEQYDRELISQCLKEVELQDSGWLRWFEAQKITRFEVTYESMVADMAGAVSSIVELLGVQNDEPSEVPVPPTERQSDDTNMEWIARYEEETRDAPSKRGEDAVATEADADQSKIEKHFFERADWLINSLPNIHSSATSFVSTLRLRRRYDAIIGQNRDLFRGARVLDIQSLDGFWSLAALDAGAAHVFGIETSPKAVRAAEKNCFDYGADAKAYQFVNARVFPTLASFEPGRFDVISCKGFFQQCSVTEFFSSVSRLRPKHVILDARIMPGPAPVLRFTLAGKSWKGKKRRITSTPHHGLMAFLSRFEFQWSVVDWRAMGVTDWTGIHEYQRDRRRIYVLTRVE